MTRTTDDLNPEPPFKPFGPKVEKPAPAKPEWRPRPGSPGILENDEGKVKTDLPPPETFPRRFP